MEIKHRGKYFLKNLSLKWSFVLYVMLCALVALALALLLSGLFSMLQNDIYTCYDDLYRSELAQQGDLVVDGVIVQKEAIWLYSANLSDKFSQQDARLYALYGALSVIIVPVVFVICILATGILFYRCKLKQPLAVLAAASARISDGDLDFHLEYDSKNEFGSLVDSFETMRESLYQTNREMWQMIEKRKQLNAAFAHDLRTPLTVLRGYCDFLLSYCPEGKISAEKTVSTLSLMDTYLRRLEGYTESMSSMQKLEDIEPSATPVSFGELCAKLESTATLLAKEKSLTFRGDGDGELSIDSALVFQVCENLLSNAVRYAGHRIDMLCCYHGRTLTITVSDDGPGFTAGALKKPQTLITVT